MNKIFATLVVILIFIIAVPAQSSTLTNQEIDKFIDSIPRTSQLLDRIKAKIKKHKSIFNSLSEAQLDGKYMRELTKAVKGWPEYSALEKLVVQSGFSSVEEWSLVVDRVFGVISSAQWVVLMAALPNPNTHDPVLSQDTNLFAYLNEEANDPALRDKYGKQLAEMCVRLCVDTSDLSVVGARYDEIESTIKKR